jgi:hypothetical protein
MKGINLTKNDMNIINDDEKTIIDTLIRLSKDHKKHHNTIDNSINKLKDRYMILLGELEAGNTNEKIIPELKDVMAKLVSLKVINYNQMVNQLKQVKNMTKT